MFTAYTEAMRLNSLLHLGLGDGLLRGDGHHRNPNMSGKEVGGAVVDDVEAPVAAEAGELKTVHADAGWQSNLPSRLQPSLSKGPHEVGWH